jgi:uncharacterized protein YjbJ (UPF0337 family)
MNRDTVKGAVDEAVGNAKQQIGKLTGNTGTRVEGAVQQLKGKAESAWGKTKDAARGAQGKVAAKRP